MSNIIYKFVTSNYFTGGFGKLKCEYRRKNHGLRRVSRKITVAKLRKIGYNISVYNARVQKQDVAAD